MSAYSPDSVKSQIHATLVEHGTGELLALWESHDRQEHSKDYFEVLKDILVERGVDVPVLQNDEEPVDDVPVTSPPVENPTTPPDPQKNAEIPNISGGRSILLFSVLMFLASLPLDVLIGPQPYFLFRGAFLLLVGFSGPLFGTFAWYANPILLFCWWQLWRGKVRGSILPGSLAFVLAATTLFFEEIPPIGFSPTKHPIFSLGLGFYLWISSILLVTWGAALLHFGASAGKKYSGLLTAVKLSAIEVSASLFIYAIRHTTFFDITTPDTLAQEVNRFLQYLTGNPIYSLACLCLFIVWVGIYISLHRAGFLRTFVLSLLAFGLVMTFVPFFGMPIAVNTDLHWLDPILPSLLMWVGSFVAAVLGALLALALSWKTSLQEHPGSE